MNSEDKNIYAEYFKDCQSYDEIENCYYALRDNPDIDNSLLIASAVIKGQTYDDKKKIVCNLTNPHDVGLPMFIIKMAPNEEQEKELVKLFLNLGFAQYMDFNEINNTASTMSQKLNDALAEIKLKEYDVFVKHRANIKYGL